MNLYWFHIPRHTQSYRIDELYIDFTYSINVNLYWIAELHIRNKSPTHTQNMDVNFKRFDWLAFHHTNPLGRKEPFTWNIPKIILCLVLDFQRILVGWTKTHLKNVRQSNWESSSPNFGVKIQKNVWDATTKTHSNCGRIGVLCRWQRMRSAEGSWECRWSKAPHNPLSPNLLAPRSGTSSGCVSSHSDTPTKTQIEGGILSPGNGGFQRIKHRRMLKCRSMSQAIVTTVPPATLTVHS